jgi:hypothetical protein
MSPLAGIALPSSYCSFQLLAPPSAFSASFLPLEPFPASPHYTRNAK